ncbi:MAG: aspartate aminotransferase family protein, partial [Euryarchaeota archaeon]|nr:aspartate aminotransferase family protein [Euryarchaeota archaeon]
MSVRAGMAALGVLEREKPYAELERLAGELGRGLEQVCEDAGAEVRVYGVASMLQLYFTSQEVRDYRTALQADAELFLRYQRGMLARGVFLAPSQYESCFLSTAHTAEDVEQTLEKASEAVREALRG